MPTYLYCLLASAGEEPPRGLTGIADEPVRRLAAGGVAAWVGTIGGGAPPRTAEAALRHDRVVRTALERGETPLPARAGQTFASDEVCGAELAARADAIARALAAVRGCVEMTVHVALPGAAIPPGRAGAARAGEPGVERGSGRAYMEALRERLQLEHFLHAEAAIARERIARAIAGLARAESWSARPGAESRLVVSHLVGRDDVARYRAALESLDESRVVRVGGPDPPYSFATVAHD